MSASLTPIYGEAAPKRKHISFEENNLHESDDTPSCEEENQDDVGDVDDDDEYPHVTLERSGKLNVVSQVLKVWKGSRASCSSFFRKLSKCLTLLKVFWLLMVIVTGGWIVLLPSNRGWP
nr:uncharacterized protein LOC103445665 [Malus domestica]